MDAQQAQRMRALLKSGRDKYTSFFACLEEIRMEIGNRSLPAWCRKHLSMPLTEITEARKLLQHIDAVKIKEALAEACAADTAEVAGLRDQVKRRDAQIQQLEAELLAAHAAKAGTRKCQYIPCGKEFTAASPAAKYCGVKCRVAAHRAARSAR